LLEELLFFPLLTSIIGANIFLTPCLGYEAAKPALQRSQHQPKPVFTQKPGKAVFHLSFAFILRGESAKLELLHLSEYLE